MTVKLPVPGEQEEIGQILSEDFPVVHFVIDLQLLSKEFVQTAANGAAPNNRAAICCVAVAFDDLSEIEWSDEPRMVQENEAFWLSPHLAALDDDALRHRLGKLYSG